MLRLVLWLGLGLCFGSGFVSALARDSVRASAHILGSCFGPGFASHFRLYSRLCQDLYVGFGICEILFFLQFEYGQIFSNKKLF